MASINWNSESIQAERYVLNVVAYIESRIQGSDHRDEDRRVWNWNDPMLVSEAFYCIGIVMAFGQLLYVFQVTYANVLFIQLWSSRGKSQWDFTDISSMSLHWFVCHIAVEESKPWKSILICTMWMVWYVFITLTSNTQMAFHCFDSSTTYLSSNQNDESSFSCVRL